MIGTFYRRDKETDSKLSFKQMKSFLTRHVLLKPNQTKLKRNGHLKRVKITSNEKVLFVKIPHSRYEEDTFITKNIHFFIFSIFF